MVSIRACDATRRASCARRRNVLICLPRKPMDETGGEMNMEPLERRGVNDTTKEPIGGSRTVAVVMACSTRCEAFLW